MTPLLKHTSQKYRQLLIVLAVTFVVAPFLEAGFGNILAISLLLYAIIVVLYSFASRRLLILHSLVAGLAFCLESIANFSEIAYLNQSFTLISQTILIIYMAGSAYWIGRDIFSEPNVTMDTVRGGVSVYLLIGFVWALLYRIVSILDANAFSQPLNQKDSYLRTLHFSFTTLTTLGYGDIVPLSEVAQVMTNLEAIVGQMYSSILIAILIGNYLAQRSS